MTRASHNRDSFAQCAGNLWPSWIKKPLFLLSEHHRRTTRIERQAFDELVRLLSPAQRQDPRVKELRQSLDRGPRKTEVPMTYSNRLFFEHREIRLAFGLPLRRPY